MLRKLEDFTTDEIFWIDLISNIICYSSCIASIFLIITCFIIKCHKEHIGRMILLIGIAGFIYSFPWWDNLLTPVGCGLISMLYAYSSVSLALPAVCFAHQLRICVQEATFDKRKIFLRYLALTQITSIIFAVLSLILNPYQLNPYGYCARIIYVSKFDVYLFLQIIPIVFCFCVSITYYILSFRRLQQIRDYLKISTNNMFGIVLMLPIFMFILWFPTVAIAIAIFAGAELNNMLINISFYVSYLQPLCNAIVFSCSPRVRIGCRNACKKRPIVDQSLREENASTATEDNTIDPGSSEKGSSSTSNEQDPKSGPWENRGLELSFVKEAQ